MNIFLGILKRRNFLFVNHFLNSPYYGTIPDERNHYKVHNYFWWKHNTVLYGLISQASSTIRLDCAIGERRQDKSHILNKSLKAKMYVGKCRGTQETCRRKKSKRLEERR